VGYKNPSVSGRDTQFQPINRSEHSNEAKAPPNIPSDSVAC